MPLHVSSTSAHRQEAKIVLYSLWYHHTYGWPSRAQVQRGLVVYFMPLHVSSTSAHRQEAKLVIYSLWYHHTYKCDDNIDRIVQFWPPDDEHFCSKHVEA